jgi:hypothetical protein
MSSPAAKNAWHAIVGFFLGGFAAQSLGIAAIALYQSVVYGRFTFVHLVSLSWRERLFCAAVSVLPALLLLRKRAYVSLGMFLYGVFAWLVTAPAQLAK